MATDTFPTTQDISIRTTDSMSTDRGTCIICVRTSTTSLFTTTRTEGIIVRFVIAITTTEGITTTDIEWHMPTAYATSTDQAVEFTVRMDVPFATTTLIQTDATR